jgi:glycosyltransferase involved in cell wall biosynthesis
MEAFEVTIGICVKNNEKTIQKAIESVVNQNFPHEKLQVIIIDGDSTDNTIPIIKRILTQKDIEYRILSDNGEGIGKARAIAVENATGKYITWVDGDIILPKEHLKEQVMFMNKNKKIGIVRGKDILHKEKSLCGTLETLTLISKAKPPQQCAGGSTYRLVAIQQVGNFNPNIRDTGEDIDMVNRIKAAGWKITVNSGIIHLARQTWKSIWIERYRWGYGWCSLKKQSNETHLAIELFSLANTLVHDTAGISRAYKKSQQKLSLLIPLYTIFALSAWLTGYLENYTKH